MKKWLSLGLAALLCLSFVACGTQNGAGSSPDVSPSDESEIPASSGESLPSEGEPESSAESSAESVEILETEPVTYTLNKKSPVKVTGRTTKVSEGITLDHSAASLTFQAKCYGDVSVKMEASAGVIFVPFIDGVRQATRVYFDPDHAEAVVAAGLEKGIHTIRLVRDTQEKKGSCTAISITMTGSFADKPKNASTYIEFIGDSITCGHGSLHGFLTEQDQLTVLERKNTICVDPTSAEPLFEESATNSYGFLTAEALGADSGFYCYSGIGLAKGLVPFNMDEYFRYTSQLRGQLYNFVNPRVPDLVVINLGTNDSGVATPPSKEEYKAAVIALIQEVRTLYGKEDLKIVWTTGMMGKAFGKYAEEAIQSLNDENLYVHLYLPEGTSGHGSHPDLLQHQKAADDLVKFIQDNHILG